MQIIRPSELGRQYGLPVLNFQFIVILWIITVRKKLSEYQKAGK
jgi:hypothetical protein